MYMRVYVYMYIYLHNIFYWGNYYQLENLKSKIIDNKKLLTNY